MTDDQTERPHDSWHTFRQWHREPQLWREIYTRTVSALAAAIVIYLVAAISGAVTREPAYIIAAVFAAIAVPLLLFSVPGVVRHWSGVRPLYVRWDHRPSPEVAYYERLYLRFNFGWSAAVVAGVFWWTGQLS